MTLKSKEYINVIVLSFDNRGTSFKMTVQTTSIAPMIKTLQQGMALGHFSVFWLVK